MRIISKYSDYYDNAVHPAYKDENVIYIRKTEVIKSSFSLDKVESISRFNQVNFEITYKNKYGIKTKMRRVYYPIYLFFAGKTYGLLASGNFNNVAPYYSDCFDNNILVVPSIELFEKQKSAELANDGYQNIEIKSDVNEPYYALDNKNYSRFKTGEIPFDSTDICLEYGTPVILAYSISKLYQQNEINSELILNPYLKELNLMNIIDPFQAWQEISMFIGGVIPGRQSPMVKISDDSKIKKAGFDPKYGFRKRPSNV